MVREIVDITMICNGMNASKYLLCNIFWFFCDIHVTRVGGCDCIALLKFHKTALYSYCILCFYFAH